MHSECAGVYPGSSPGANGGCGFHSSVLIVESQFLCVDAGGEQN